MKKYDFRSRVEEQVRRRSGFAFRYPPTEKTRVMVVPGFPELGRVAALRFLEWLQRNPGGCVCLPTGKSPEHFINWTAHYLDNWRRDTVKRELAGWGLDPGRRPEMGAYDFIQIDEFYPMNPRQENSFAHYINRFYIRRLGFDPQRALLMNTWDLGAPAGVDLETLFRNEPVDLTLRYRQPADEWEASCRGALTAVDQYAQFYENQVRARGGIGFFLGGIGPDGHIGFNIRGASPFSTTRLDHVNYETAAAAAVDLGGIEVARRKLVLTIGLGTITANPTVTALVIAAGDVKARVVRDAVEEDPSIFYPATALHPLPGAAFLVTASAASQLVERKTVLVRRARRPAAAAVTRAVIDCAWQRRRRLAEMTAEDLVTHPTGRVLLEKGAFDDLTGERAARQMAGRIRHGTRRIAGTTFLHTAPHHDDIMLGYLPYIIHLVREPTNVHYFATLTSGFTSVTNRYAAEMLDTLAAFFDRPEFKALHGEGYFAADNIQGRNRDIYQYLDGVARQWDEIRREGEARRMMRNMVELVGGSDRELIARKVRQMKDYFLRAYPGRRDSAIVQQFKGMIREWEEELTWSHLGFNAENIMHLRVGFYTGGIFTPRPEWERDIRPFVELLERTRPGVVTVALDPEGSGPDTHYKVLQIIATALEIYGRKHDTGKLRVLGYRNVWFRFHPAEANVYVPVSMNSLATIKSTFHTCFGSQRSASFPSPEYDGPFCDLAVRIMVDQYSLVKNCLGRDFFYRHPQPRLRATRGMNFLREMSCAQFCREARLLREALEKKD